MKNPILNFHIIYSLIRYALQSHFSFLWNISLLILRLQFPKSNTKTCFSEATYTQNIQNKPNRNPSTPKCPAFFQNSPKTPDPLNRASLNFALIFCVWLLLLLLVLQHHHITIILIIPFVFISCQSKGSVSCQSSRGKAILSNSNKSSKFCVVCISSNYTPRIPMYIHTYLYLSVCHSSACACLQK